MVGTNRRGRAVRHRSTSIYGRIGSPHAHKPNLLGQRPEPALILAEHGNKCHSVTSLSNKFACSLDRQPTVVTATENAQPTSGSNLRAPPISTAIFALAILSEYLTGKHETPINHKPLVLMDLGHERLPEPSRSIISPGQRRRAGGWFG